VFVLCLHRGATVQIAHGSVSIFLITIKYNEKQLMKYKMQEKSASS